MFCCRGVYSAKRQILSYFYSKEPVIETTHEKLGPYFITRMESISLDKSYVRYRVTNNKHVEPIDEKIEEPWLWLGSNGDDYTDLVRSLLVTGNHITLDLLGILFPGRTNWVYLDPVTFKEVDFPVEGITINAARVETSS